MKYLYFVIIFLLFFVAPILAQSLPRPVAGTKYAPVYVEATGEFGGWEGEDGTFISNQGQFFPSVNYNGISVKKGPYAYTVMFNIETYEIQYFTVGVTQYSVDGTGLPLFSLEKYDYGAEYVFENPEGEDYPMPPSGTDENGQFTQRLFLHVYPSDFFTASSLRDSHLRVVGVYDYSTYSSNSVPRTQYYSGAGPSPVMMAYYAYLESLQQVRVVVVSDRGDKVAKDGLEFFVCSGVNTEVDFIGKIVKVPSCQILSRIIGESPLTSVGYPLERWRQCYWSEALYSDSRLASYGNFEQAIFRFYLRDQYLNYKTDVSFLAKLHKKMNGYEIWYADRKYYAAGYSDSNSDGSGDGGAPPTLPSPPTELSEFKYFSKDEDGKYHLKIDGVLNDFKKKLKEKYKFNFLGVGDDTEGDNVGKFQFDILSSIEEVESAEPFSVEVEHRFDIVTGNFRNQNIQVENTKLVFDYHKWFDVEILHVIRSIILFVLCIEFFFMTLKLFI
jgi:hypothetical protein